MIPIDSPKLQIFPQSLTILERHQMLANISLFRALSRLRVSNTSTTTNSFKDIVYEVQGSYYVTQLQFGSPSGDLFSSYVLLDTADRNTWVQCEGCNPCFELNLDNIRVHDSATYRLMSPHDPRCEPQEVYQGSCGFFGSIWNGKRGFHQRSNGNRFISIPNRQNTTI